MVQNIQGLVIGDKGYLSATLKHDLHQMGIDLETTLRDNMNDSRFQPG